MMKVLLRESRERRFRQPGRIALRLLLALALSSLSFTQRQPIREYATDLAQSELSLTLVQEGLLSRKYPTHQVVVKNFNIAITLPRDEKQTAVQVYAEAKSFANADKTMSEFERRGFHDVLHNKVLECDRFPAIQFKSVNVSDLKKAGDTRSFNLHGDLSLHGVTRRASFPVTVVLGADGLRASGEAKLKQSDYGIAPYAGNMGLIKIGDELQIKFSLVAKLKGDGGAKK
jgi:polyisoprenoid-binding protein YceI